MTFATAMFLIKTGGKYGVKLYKVPGGRNPRQRFQSLYPESKILKMDLFYGSNPAQHSELPQLGKEDARLEEGVPASEEAWGHQGSDREAESPKNVRPKWDRSKWKGYRAQATNKQRREIHPKKSEAQKPDSKPARQQEIF